MATFHFDLVSPEKRAFSGDVDQVDLPGAEGDMGILPGHAPLVTTLRPGIVTIFRDNRREPIVVTGDPAAAKALVEPFMKAVVANFGNEWEMTTADIDAALDVLRGAPLRAAS